jgi:hypothetical protein
MTLVSALVTRGTECAAIMQMRGLQGLVRL